MRTGLGTISISKFASTFSQDVAQAAAPAVKNDRIRADDMDKVSSDNAGQAVHAYFEATADHSLTTGRMQMIAQRRAEREGTRVDRDGDGAIDPTEGQQLSPLFARSYQIAAESTAPNNGVSVNELKDIVGDFAETTLCDFFGVESDFEIHDLYDATDEWWAPSSIASQLGVESDHLIKLDVCAGGKDGSGRERDVSAGVVVDRRDGAVLMAYVGRYDRLFAGEDF